MDISGTDSRVTYISNSDGMDSLVEPFGSEQGADCCDRNNNGCDFVPKQSLTMDTCVTVFSTVQLDSAPEQLSVKTIMDLDHNIDLGSNPVRGLHQATDNDLTDDSLCDLVNTAEKTAASQCEGTEGVSKWSCERSHSKCTSARSGEGGAAGDDPTVCVPETGGSGGNEAGQVDVSQQSVETEDCAGVEQPMDNSSKDDKHFCDGYSPDFVDTSSCEEMVRSRGTGHGLSPDLTAVTPDLTPLTPDPTPVTPDPTPVTPDRQSGKVRFVVGEEAFCDSMCERELAWEAGCDVEGSYLVSDVERGSGDGGKETLSEVSKGRGSVPPSEDVVTYQACDRLGGLMESLRSVYVEQPNPNDYLWDWRYPQSDLDPSYDLPDPGNYSDVMRPGLDQSSHNCLGSKTVLSSSEIPQSDSSDSFHTATSSGSLHSVSSSNSVFAKPLVKGSEPLSCSSSQDQMTRPGSPTMPVVSLFNHSVNFWIMEID